MPKLMAMAKGVLLCEMRQPCACKHGDDKVTYAVEGRAQSFICRMALCATLSRARLELQRRTVIAWVLSGDGVWGSGSLDTAWRRLTRRWR